MNEEACVGDVLIVDDKQENLKVLATLLAEQGYRVRPALNGKLALQAMEQKIPDVVLLDILMPDLDGYEICRRIKANPLWNNVPVLFLSALSQREDKLPAFAGGAADYITKPFYAEEVLARVATHVGLSRARREREHLVFQLNERIKELRALYTVTRMVHNTTDIKVMLSTIPDEVVSGWQYPEFTRCHIHFKGQTYGAPLPPPLACSQSASICVGGIEQGVILVYMEDCSQIHFLSEEQDLLDNLAHVIGEALERQNMEDQLRDSNLRYQALFQHMNSGVAVFSAIDDGADFAFASVNRAGEKIIRQRHEQVKSRLVTEIFPDFPSSGLLSGLQKVWHSGEAEYFSNFHYQDNDRELWLESRIYKLPSDELVVVFDDVSARHHSEEMLRQARDLLEERVTERTQELEQANLQLRELSQLKDEFLASMSHELRSPLNAILGSVEILQEEIYGVINDKQNRSLERVRESAGHLLSLINDILDVAKVEAGKLQLDVQLVSPHDISLSCLSLIKELALKKRLKIRTMFEDNVDVIQADARRLKQILLNLLSNAVKFTPEGGEIGLSFMGDAERGQVRFTIHDTGIGIAEDKLQRLFQPFVQLDSSLSRHYSGTGLGLALVKRLTDLHGGSVGVTSTLEAGSQFTVILPWQPITEVPTEQEQDSDDNAEDVPEKEEIFPLSQGVRVLVVEDSEHNRTMLCDYLQAKGYHTLIAQDGVEAIHQARSQPPDLILMDIQMPGMDGLEATRQIRADPRMAGIPIIALTALAMQGDRERCLEAGVDAYLSKPVVIKDLLQEMEILVQAKKQTTDGSMDG